MSIYSPLQKFCLQ